MISPLRLRLVVVVAGAAAALLGAAAAAAGVPPLHGTAMPWLCLERCHEHVASDVAQVLQLEDVLGAASFEAYDLAPTQPLWNNFTAVGGPLEVLAPQVARLPMITSVNLPLMRAVFKEPDAFVAAAVAEAVRRNYTGYNLDFEPNSETTADDAAAYAKFLGVFSRAAHASGLLLTADSGGPLGPSASFWDLKALGASGVDRLYTMSTYCANTTLFEERLAQAVADVGVDRLGVGLMTVNPNTNRPFSAADVKARFDALDRHAVQAIAFWQAPVPDSWVPFTRAFVESRRARAAGLA